MTQVTEAIDVAPRPAPPPFGIAPDAEIRYYTASQFQLMWWKFKKHKLALIGSAILGLFTIVAMFAEFLSPYAPAVRTPNYLFGRPQVLHFVDADGKLIGMVTEHDFLRQHDGTRRPWLDVLFADTGGQITTSELHDRRIANVMVRTPCQPANSVVL